MQQGSLKLEFANSRGNTKLVSSYCLAPFKVQRPFYPEGNKIAHLVVLHTAGGIVGGDLLTSDIRLHSDCNVLTTTATAGKIYRSLGAISQSNIAIKVATGSCLEWFPQETIIFNGALYRQQIKVELEEKAIFCGWEINRYGRTARGELFLSGESRSAMEVWQTDCLLWVDRQKIIGDEKFITSLNGLSGNSVTGTLVLLGLILPKVIWEELNKYSPVIDGELGLTSLSRGVLIRYRGNSSQEARRIFQEIWSILRPFYLGVTSCPMRIWQ